MKVPARASIAACEKLLYGLARESSDARLLIPTRLKHAIAGGEPAFIQFLFSWAQRHNSAICKTFATSPEDDQVAEFSRRPYGIVASLLSSQILGRSGQDLTQLYQDAAIKKLDQWQGRDPQSATRTTSVEVAAADHLGRGSPVFLYSRDREGIAHVRPRDQFVRLAQYLATKTRSDQTLLHPPPRRAVQAIGNLLYELFKNTHDHARTHLSGQRPPFSFRLFQASTIAQRKQELELMVSEFPPLSRFFSTLTPIEEREFVSVFVLSVVDSGPGLAQTWTRRELCTMSEQEELDATIECFSKGSTTKIHSQYGEGLHLVRSILRDGKGLLRLRTGRLSLYYEGFADFGEDSSEIPLKSWRVEYPLLAPASGTLVTLFLPLIHK